MFKHLIELQEEETLIKNEKEKIKRLFLHKKVKVKNIGNQYEEFEITQFHYNATNKGDKIYSLVFIYISSAVLMFAAAWIFFSIGFVFLGRIAVLWLLMAIAPLAFAAMILPKTRDMANEWWAELFSKSFCITVFLFFIWLIAVFANSGFISQSSEEILTEFKDELRHDGKL